MLTTLETTTAHSTFPADLKDWGPGELADLARYVTDLCLQSHQQTLSHPGLQADREALKVWRTNILDLKRAVGILSRVY